MVRLFNEYERLSVSSDKFDFKSVLLDTGPATPACSLVPSAWNTLSHSSIGRLCLSFLVRSREDLGVVGVGETAQWLRVLTLIGCHWEGKLPPTLAQARENK